jgi:glyoxylase-like metal-dependent hydrolase (beta-lactamase superfamily II)
VSCRPRAGLSSPPLTGRLTPDGAPLTARFTASPPPGKPPVSGGTNQPPKPKPAHSDAPPVPESWAEVRAHHTPGHSPGGVCLEVTEPGSATKTLVVGDTLFAGSIGRTDLPGGDYDTLLKAITGVLFSYPDDSIVYSGHGPETTIGREKATNPFVLEYLARS